MLQTNKGNYFKGYITAFNLQKYKFKIWNFETKPCSKV